MAACTKCGISSNDLPEGRICGDCLAQYQPTQKAKDFVEWLKKKRPEEYERALMSNVADDDKVQ